ncbi:MAG: signal recognition particle-docking protein FtsY [Candidatus Atribacteria bacterium]|nr:signal recognition particle-docking protein FtsY [Candidatus Atribacteria bacterium]
MRRYKRINKVLLSLKDGLKKTRNSFLSKYDLLFTDAIKDKQGFLDKIEELLILSDLGYQITESVLERFKEMDLHQFKIHDFNYFKNILEEVLLDMFPGQKTTFDIDSDKLKIIMVVGVNGTGKTSFIGKLGYLFRGKGKKVLMVPADTYRAGAISQLGILANKTGVEMLKASANSDPAAVVFDGMQSAIAKKKELLIIDTAGRLHTNHNLMKELEKIKRVVLKLVTKESLMTTLVIDATTGQNGINQALYFKESLDLSNLALTKLDGTAKGGIALAIQKDLHIPIEYITFGEGITDLCEYNAEAFITALLD